MGRLIAGCNQLVSINSLGPTQPQQAPSVGARSCPSLQQIPNQTISDSPNGRIAPAKNLSYIRDLEIEDGYLG
jgi:hypothetical protein